MHWAGGEDRRLHCDGTHRTTHKLHCGRKWVSIIYVAREYLDNTCPMCYVLFQGAALVVLHIL